MKYNLSELKDIIEDRRSIYPNQFSQRKVHQEIVEELLDMARWAPTHKLTQPWRFKVFMDKGLEKLARFQADLYEQKKTTDFKSEKHAKLLGKPMQSSAVIAICLDRDPNESIPEWEEIACIGAAVQNIYLMCSAYGLAGYWSSGFPTNEPETKEFLGLEAKDKCLGLFYLGYPEEWPKKGQRRPIEYYTEWIKE